MTVIAWTTVWMIVGFVAMKYIPVMIKFKTVHCIKKAKGHEWNALRCSAEEEVCANTDFLTHMQTLCLQFLPMAEMLSKLMLLTLRTQIWSFLPKV